MVDYNSSEIVDISLCLVKLNKIIVEQSDCYNRYPFRRHPNVMQIRRILFTRAEEFVKKTISK